MFSALKKLGNPSYRYVVISTLVSLISFGRNVLFMKTLGLGDLGQVAVMQTIVMLVGFSQLGLINGSYLLYADRKREINQHIVNLLWFFFGLVLSAYCLFLIFDLGGIGEPTIAKETLIVGLAAGIATLASTWLNNALIAEGSLNKSNIINVVAVSTSLVIAFFSADFGLIAALVSIFVQPIFIMLGALVLDWRLRPSHINVHRVTLTRVFHLGLMQFLGGVATLMSYQLERWAIVLLLGEEALGKFYLVIMYMAFFILIPASLLNLYFPRASRALLKNDYDTYKEVIRLHLRDLSIYCCLAIIITIMFLPWTLRTFFPQFESTANLIFILLPTMVIFSFRDTVSLVLYSNKNTKPIFLSGIILISIYALLIITSEIIGVFSLENVLFFRGAAVVVSTFYLYYIRQRISKTLDAKYIL